MYFSPIFESIMQQVKAIPEDQWDTSRANRLFRLLHKYAPPEFNKLVIHQAQKEGLFPKPTHCDENGEPIYNLEEFAAHFGKTPEEAQQALQEMLADDPDQADYLYNGPVYQLQ